MNRYALVFRLHAPCQTKELHIILNNNNHLIAQYYAAAVGVYYRLNTGLSSQQPIAIHSQLAPRQAALAHDRDHATMSTWHIPRTHFVCTLVFHIHCCHKSRARARAVAPTNHQPESHKRLVILELPFRHPQQAISIAKQSSVTRLHACLVISPPNLYPQH
jgi:hypothetical protein